MSKLEWQPIETAPKDGSNVLLLFCDADISVGRWDAQEYHKKPRPLWVSQQHRGYATEDRYDQPTHWLDLSLLAALAKGGE